MGEFLSSIDWTPVFNLVWTALAAVLAWVGNKIKEYYNAKVTNETVREVIRDCVNYVEQKSKTEKIQNKFNLAKEKAVIILNSKGIEITEDEIEVLIESFVNGLTSNTKETKTTIEE